MLACMRLISRLSLDVDPRRAFGVALRTTWEKCRIKGQPLREKLTMKSKMTSRTKRKLDRFTFKKRKKKKRPGRARRSVSANYSECENVTRSRGRESRLESRLASADSIESASRGANWQDRSSRARSIPRMRRASAKNRSLIGIKT